MKSPPNFYRVIQIILQMCLCDQSLVTLGFLWGRLSQPQFHKALTRKIPFLRGGLEILQQCDKRVNTKSKKFWWSIRTFVEVTSDKMERGEGVRGAICSPPPPSLIGLIAESCCLMSQKAPYYILQCSWIWHCVFSERLLLWLVLQFILRFQVR